MKKTEFDTDRRIGITKAFSDAEIVDADQDLGKKGQREEMKKTVTMYNFIRMFLIVSPVFLLGLYFIAIFAGAPVDKIIPPVEAFRATWILMILIAIIL